jgi:hypothetical protein
MGTNQNSRVVLDPLSVVGFLLLMSSGLFGMFTLITVATNNVAAWVVFLCFVAGLVILLVRTISNKNGNQPASVQAQPTQANNNPPAPTTTP